MQGSDPSNVSASKEEWLAEIMRRQYLSRLGFTPLLSRYDPRGAAAARRLTAATPKDTAFEYQAGATESLSPQMGRSSQQPQLNTGIGFGIGIPHASTDLIDDVTGAFGRSKQGVDFDSLDNQPVKLVMLFLVPQGQFQKHLHTLAKIAKVLHKKEFRKSLEESEDAAEMYQIIRSSQEG